MIRYGLTCIAGLTLTLNTSFAGVLLEMGTRNIGSQAASTDQRLYAQGSMLRMEMEGSGESGSVIFRDNALYILDHKKKTYHRMDEQTMAQIGSQMDDAMKQMQAELDKLPPDQRAMVERMMKGQMPQTAQAPQRPARTVRLEGSEAFGKYSCKKYGVYEGNRKVQEILAAPMSQLPEMAEAMEAIRALTRFTERLVQSFRQGPFAGMIDNSFQHLDQIDGFPVVTRDFSGGRATSETFLKSATKQSIADSMFSLPPGYTQQMSPNPR